MSTGQGRSGALTIRRIGERPDPPEDMPEGAALVWRDVVAAMPAGYFTPETLALLSMYCTHVFAWVRSNNVIETMWMSGEPDSDALKEWQGIRDKEQKAAGSIATRLRLTPQAKYDQSKRIPSGNGQPSPWEK